MIYQLQIVQMHSHRKLDPHGVRFHSSLTARSVRFWLNRSTIGNDHTKLNFMKAQPRRMAIVLAKI